MQNYYKLIKPPNISLFLQRLNTKEEMSDICFKKLKKQIVLSGQNNNIIVINETVRRYSVTVQILKTRRTPSPNRKCSSHDGHSRRRSEQ